MSLFEGSGLLWTKTEMSEDNPLGSQGVLSNFGAGVLQPSAPSTPLIIALRLGYQEIAGYTSIPVQMSLETSPGEEGITLYQSPYQLASLLDVLTELLPALLPPGE